MLRFVSALLLVLIAKQIQAMPKPNLLWLKSVAPEKLAEGTAVGLHITSAFLERPEVKRDGESKVWWRVDEKTSSYCEISWREQVVAGEFKEVIQGYATSSGDFDIFFHDSGKIRRVSCRGGSPVPTLAAVEKWFGGSLEFLGPLKSQISVDLSARISAFKIRKPIPVVTYEKTVAGMKIFRSEQRFSGGDLDPYRSRIDQKGCYLGGNIGGGDWLSPKIIKRDLLKKMSVSSGFVSNEGVEFVNRATYFPVKHRDGSVLWIELNCTSYDLSKPFPKILLEEAGGYFDAK